MTIWLPAQVNKPAVPVDLPRLQPALLPVNGKVLLVDDDPLVLEVVRACLNRAGHEVVIARDGREGLEFFQRHMHDVGLVLSDVTMPELSGIDMVLRIRQIKPSMNVILMSGDAEATREEKLAALNPDQPVLLKKPFALKDLLNAIGKPNPRSTPEVQSPGNPAAAECGWDAAFCAGPWLRSGECVRG